MPETPKTGFFETRPILIKPQSTSLLSSQTLSTVPLYGVHTQTKVRGRSKWSNIDTLDALLTGIYICAVSEICWKNKTKNLLKAEGFILLYQIMNDMVGIQTSLYITQASARTRSKAREET